MTPSIEIRFNRVSARGLLVLVIALLGCTFAAATRDPVAADDVPPWLRQLASSSLPSYDGHIPAVVLWREQVIRVEEDGKVTTVERQAVRILSKEGRDEAFASVHYTTDTGKVRDMRAWMIRPGGTVKKFGKDEVVDLAAAPNDVFNDVRVKIIAARDEAEPGAVFGYEWTAEDRSVFTQFDWQFQDRLPALVSRFTITLPAGWRAEGVMLNHDKLEPVVNGSTYSWELRDLSFIEEEPASPPVTALAARLAVSYFPPPEKRAGAGVFNNWADVSRWLTALSEGQATLDDALAGKARQLTSNAKTELERVQAIGRYVQGVNYVSIQTGIGRGGGYRPHSAIEVFAKSYGDCKDKANLMRAMLKAIGIQSYLVCIYSGDPFYVRQEWPSPQQFNHCIIAVKLSDETQAATIVNHPSLGRLLIFDPTDDSTPVGALPDHEQGSFALIVAGEAGALLRMPETPPEANRLDRQADVVLLADGGITANLRERSIGQSAVDSRREFRGLSRTDYVKRIEGWITRGATGATVSKVEASDSSAEGRFALDVDFTAARYGQLMQDRLLVFKPAIVSRRESLFLTEAARRYPVVLTSLAYSETVRVKLPGGFEVDELPDPAKLDTPFGTYATTYVVKEEQLSFTRTLLVRGATIPVKDYSKVRAFFASIRAAEQAPVVLARK
jgi:transglutaminase-like putative cysteine protease